MGLTRTSAVFVRRAGLWIEVYQQAAVKLAPLPLAEAPEAAESFVQHNALIEEQRAGKPLGLLVAGFKKDVVKTNPLRDKPNRVAMYSWHKLDGQPFQPLTSVHKNTYVDYSVGYSHGIRPMRRMATVDDRFRDIRNVLRSPDLSPLLSDEGRIVPQNE